MSIYGYMTQKNLEELVMNDRIAWVVKSIKLKDKPEYINMMLNNLKELGFNINILTRCNLLRQDNNDNIVILVRKHVQLDQNDKQAMGIFTRRMGNVVTAQEFIKGCSSDACKLICSVSCKDRKDFKVEIKLDLDVNKNIQKAIIVSPDFKDINGIEISNLENDIPRIIERVYGILYKGYKYNITKCYYMIEGKLFKYSVIPTVTGVQLKLS